MFPFKEIERLYNFQNAEKEIFESLNEFTYNNFGRSLHGSFTDHDPPTFELIHPKENERSIKPLVTKVTVTIHRNNKTQEVIARTSTNPVYWFILGIILFYFIKELINKPSFILIAGNLVVIIGLIAWDRFIKNQILKRMEKAFP